MTETFYQLHQTIELDDGRTLGYAQYGDPSGRPVYFFHGQPGNRLFHPDEETTQQAKVNLIVPDRPGYGLSDYYPGRTLVDWADDVRQLAARLGHSQFDIIGYSAGGPYALACAAKIPENLGQVMLISSAAPVHERKVRKEMSQLVRFNYFMARWLPRLMQLIFRIYWRQAKSNPASFIEMAKKDAPVPDLEALNQQTLYQMMLACWKENLRVDCRGYVEDAKIIFKEWGFSLAEIEKKVLLYWGKEDQNTPPSCLAYLVSHLPYTQPTVVAGAGHFGFLTHWGEVLNLLT